MRGVIRAKWRPSLWMVIGGVILAVLALPVLGLITLPFLRAQFGDSAYLVAGMGVLGGAALLGFVLWRLLLRPIHALSAHAKSVADGAEPEALAHYGTTELRDLGQVVLDMGASLKSREAAVRAYSEHITHELKSPTTAILGAAEMLGDADLSASDQRLLSTIQTSGHRMAALLGALREFAAASDRDYRGTVLLDEVIAELRDGFPMLSIEADSARLNISAEGLSMVLLHLLGNSAAHGAGRVCIQFSDVQLLYEDDGKGIAAEAAPHIFEPFFTTRRESGGTGMGLAIVARLLDAHGGAIRLLPCAKGARFEVTLPN